MLNNRISIKRTVFYDVSTGHICQCSGDFWKTCALRVANTLPCFESIVSITPIVRGDVDPATDSVRALHKSLADLTDSLRKFENKIRF